MTYISTVMLLVLIGCTATESWTPSANPEPHAILREAQQDTRAGHYEIALAKFVWFHENALKFEPALAGVRTSFALSYWNELAQKHPPAMFALRQAREQAAADVLASRDLRRSFQDVATIDRTLGQEARTRELFERLNREQPDVARDVFSLAQRALVAQKSFELANDYLNPSADMARLVERYRKGLRTASELGRPEHREFTRKSFTHNASTLVALLVVNGRVEEAEAVAAAARKEIQDEASERSLVSALQGSVPEPWP